jgi:hypothetical protein
MLAPVLAADGIKIDDLVIAGRIPAAQREATVKAVPCLLRFLEHG